MGKTPQNTGEGKGAASPFEEAQQIVDDLIKNVKDAQFRVMLAEDNEKFMAAEPVDAPEELTEEDIEATEQLKAAIRQEQQCNYVRGLCKLTIKRKRDSPEAIEAAKKVLELLHKIEKGDYSLWRELDDATYLLLSELEANRGSSAKGRHPQPKTRKVPAETKQKDEGNKIMITAVTSKENWESIKTEYDISKKDFGKKINFVSDSFKRTIIFRDVEHAFVLASQGFSKPALILAGGVVEELLRLYLEHKNIKLKNKRFVDYIKACEDNGLLKRGVYRLLDSIRDFRNLVHLDNEKTKRHTVSKATAKGAVSSIFTIANDFQ